MQDTNETPKSIDEQLAEANRQFEARLAADAKAARKAEGVRVTQKPPKPVLRPKVQKHRPGEVAHQHFNETDYEIVEKDCLYVEHTVRDRKGFKINGKLFQGKVIVPQCVADYLQMMENRHRSMERGVFEDRGRQLDMGELRG